MKKYLSLLLIAATISCSAFAQDISGSWNGTLNAGIKLRLVFTIELNNGVYTTTMDSPDQGAKGIPTSATSFENQELTISIQGSNVSYKGKFENDSIKGIFTQSGASFPLLLTKGEVAEIRRPQDPQPPYPYQSEDIRFENRKANITLAGTLTYPKSGNNFPAVILVSGSSPQNRNSEILNHRPFLVLSDYLTRNGIAVLRYDDRGTAESGGTYATASMQDFATDAEAAIEYLKTRNEINSAKIGVIGHSEGGTIAFILAGENNNLAFIVSMAGAAIKGDSLMKEQRYMIGKASGLSDEMIATNEELVAALYNIVETNSAEYIHENMNEFIDELLPENARTIEQARKAYQQEILRFLSPELLSIIKFDPTNSLQNITCPVLALNGDKDLQVAADTNLQQVEKLVKSSVTTKKYANLNHLFQPCETGLINEYSTIETTISPEVLKDITDWILNVTK